MSKTSITIEFDPDDLRRTSDQHLALLWHLSQANPADGFASQEPGRMAMHIGWEIIRRWLGTVPPELHHHQDHHYWWHELIRVARYQPGGEPYTPEWEQGHWAPRAIPDTPELRQALTAKLEELKVFAADSMSRAQIAQELTGIVLPEAADAKQDAEAGR